ncbi:MAG: phytanoyl-CoA dioxygenase family protein [Candidatus Omnitrophica bacterium]|nr:phytanoyl-CoA dioxygenase family protein [Candidatus Omnitrophota bacterium]
MPSLLKGVERRVRTGFSVCAWRLLGRRRYFQAEAFLKRPDGSKGEGDLALKKVRLYEDGFVTLSSNRYAQAAGIALAAFRRDFEEAIRIYEAPGPSGGRIVRIDDQKRCWSWIADSGVIRLLYEDRGHPLYEGIFGKGHSLSQARGGAATLQDLYARYPFVQHLVEDPDLVSMARYANGGDSSPIAIQIERKVHSEKPDYSFLHFDTIRSTLKAYLYLTDVEEGCGPLAISKGSHHWKRHPLMLEEIMARRKTRFSPEEIRRYGISPPVPIHGKAGSLFCFTSNAIHSATDVAPGRERWSVHLYYYSLRRYSSDWS